MCSGPRRSRSRSQGRGRERREQAHAHRRRATRGAPRGDRRGAQAPYAQTARAPRSRAASCSSFLTRRTVARAQQPGRVAVDCLAHRARLTPPADVVCGAPARDDRRRARSGGLPSSERQTSWCRSTEIQIAKWDNFPHTCREVGIQPFDVRRLGVLHGDRAKPETHQQAVTKRAGRSTIAVLERMNKDDLSVRFHAQLHACEDTLSRRARAFDLAGASLDAPKFIETQALNVATIRRAMRTEAHKLGESSWRTMQSRVRANSEEDLPMEFAHKFKRSRSPVELAARDRLVQQPQLAGQLLLFSVAILGRVAHCFPR